MKRLLFAFLSVFMLCYCVWADESAPDVGLLNHCESKDCQARIQLAWMGVVSVGGSAACATPNNGNVLDDALATGEGGDAVTWTETTTGTCTVSAQDSTLTGTPPTASCLKGYKVACTYATPTNNTHGYYWDAGEPGIDLSSTALDVVADIYINSDSYLAAYGAGTVLGLNDSTSLSDGPRNALKAKRNNAAAGAPNQLYVQGSTAIAGNITTNTWYTVKIHLDTSETDNCDANCINPEAGSSGCSYMQISTDGTPDTETKLCFRRNTAADTARYLFIQAHPQAADNVYSWEIGYVYANTP